MTEAQINQILRRVDPMSTGGNENQGMEDEYSSLAHTIQVALANGVAPREAALAAFDAAFWDGCLLTERRLPALNAVLTALEANDTAAP